MSSLSWSDLDDLDEEEFIGVVGCGLVAEVEQGIEHERLLKEEEHYLLFLDDRERLRDDDKFIIPGMFRFLKEAPLLNDGGRSHTMPSVKRPFQPRVSPLTQAENATATDATPLASPSWSDLDDLEEGEFIDVVESGLVERAAVEEVAPIVPIESTCHKRRWTNCEYYPIPGSNRLLVDVPLPNDCGRPHIIPLVKSPFRPRASLMAQVQKATDDEYDVEEGDIVEELITLRQCTFRAARMALSSADAAVDALACTAPDNVEEAPVLTETDDDRYLESYDEDFECENMVEEQAQRCFPAGLTLQLRYLDMFDDISVVNDDGRTHHHVLTPETKPRSWTRPRASLMSTVEYAYPPTTTLATATVEHDRESTDDTATPVVSEDDKSDEASDSGYFSEEETTSLPLSAPEELTAIAENPALTVTPDHACENPVYTESPVTGEEDTAYTANLVVEEEVASFGHYFLGKSIAVLRSLQAVIDATLELVR
ncbi:hypothetical protein MMC26_006235 [Xylographa opegraphella]|nr:hypothetical protein [Xylographa opegraphella]